MHPLKNSLFFFSIVAPLVTAAPAGKASTSTVTREYCFTRQGTSSVRHVPTYTTTYSHGHTYTSTSTVTPTITVKPTAKTKTSTVDTTTTLTQTATTKTDTTTVTSTQTATTTSTTISSSTETDTTTTTFSTTTTTTSTIPASSGFTPIASVSSVQQGGGGSDAGPPTSKRDIDERGLAAGLTGLLHPLKLSTNKDQCPKTYPQKVTCFEQIDTFTVQTTTVTASQTATVTGAKPPTVRTTTTDVETVTTTVTPADTTVTASSTTTTTQTTILTSINIQTTTTTVSTTTTSFAAAASVYAACAADNVIDKIGSLFIAQVQATTAFSGTGNNDMAHPVNCCNICQSQSNCAGWFIANPGGFYGCTTIPAASGTCDPSSNVWGFHTSGSFSETFHVGDGPCGVGQFLGVSS